MAWSDKPSGAQQAIAAMYSCGSMPARMALWLLLFLQHGCPEMPLDHSRPGIASSQLRSLVTSPLHTGAQLLQVFAMAYGSNKAAVLCDCCAVPFAALPQKQPCALRPLFCMAILLLAAAAPYQRQLSGILLTSVLVEGVHHLPEQLPGLALAINRAVTSLKPIPCNTYASYGLTISKTTTQISCMHIQHA